MKTKHLAIILLSFGIQTQAFSQTCSSSAGIDLSKGSGAFSGLPARDQGQLGTCYAHSGSDLLSSYLKAGRINIFQTAVANDTSMDGGSPGDVINSFSKLGWACTDVGLFKDLFPSVSKNIIGELQETFLGTPIFYTNELSVKGRARQDRIAKLAAELAISGVTPKPAQIASDSALLNYKNLNNQIANLEAQISKLEDSKSWFGSNEDIDKKISQLKVTIKGLKKKADVEHGIYAKGLGRPSSQNLDLLSEEDAAEVVYAAVKSQWLAFSRIMGRYGLRSSMPGLPKFIVERVASKDGSSYAGAMYPFKVIKDVMNQICPAHLKKKIPANLRGSSLTMKKDGSVKIQEKIESLLEMNRQAVSISFNSSLLTGSTGDQHAVNIIGCRTNGRSTEYLIQNSWGQSCSKYKTSLQSKCSQGRIWVPASGLLSSSSEINWISGN